ncbi:MAG: agmatinase family protein [Bacteroidetes bacterium]|nr:agmatinase family protein [Bacteroidota bacterium]
MTDNTSTFDPNAVSSINSNLFGLPFTPEDARLIIIPVPWEVTVSYNDGTARGPEEVFKASRQVDLYDALFTDMWKEGIAMTKISHEWQLQNEALRTKAQQYLEQLDKDVEFENKLNPDEINKACFELNEWVKNEALNFLERGKMVGVLGGDHSVSLGLIQALAARGEEFGILQIDAHKDLRKAFENFDYSHASIMYNALKETEVVKLVQVGVRDYCDEEVEYVKDSAGRVTVYTDQAVKDEIYAGGHWNTITEKIIQELPQNIYISFDIDGLDPSLCPNTGTPVPGGLNFNEAAYLLHSIVQSGKKIIGFDLCEVAPSKDSGNNWDANVGARILYKLCCATLVSQLD